MSFENYGMRVEVRFWIRDPMNGVNNVRSDVNREIWRLFKKHGITIPVQQHDVRGQREPTPGHAAHELDVEPGLEIPDSDLEVAFIRSAGPGGQNVNKVASAVQLRFALARNATLRDDVKARLRALAGQRVTDAGELLIARANRAAARNRTGASAEERLLRPGAARADRAKETPSPPNPRAPRRNGAWMARRARRRTSACAGRVRFRSTDGGSMTIVWREKLLATGNPLPGDAGACAPAPRRSFSWCGSPIRSDHDRRHRAASCWWSVCDLALGPLISLVIYNSRKARRKLIIDYTIVGVVQLAALVYGVYIVAGTRPVYVAFSTDRIESRHRRATSATRSSPRRAIRAYANAAARRAALRRPSSVPEADQQRCVVRVGRSATRSTPGRSSTCRYETALRKIRQARP